MGYENMKVSKLRKADIADHRNHLSTMEYQMPYGITQCYRHPAVVTKASLIAQFVISRIINFLRESRDLSRSFHCFK